MYINMLQSTISVFDKHDFNNYLFCQWHTPTASMKDAILNLVWQNVCMPS